VERAAVFLGQFARDLNCAAFRDQLRLMLGIFLRSSASPGHEHPFLQTAILNYAALLGEMGRSPVQILARLKEFARPFDINFGSGTLSQIARQCQLHRRAITIGSQGLPNSFDLAVRESGCISKRNSWSPEMR
jgi:hypothetical protein